MQTRTGLDQAHKDGQSEDAGTIDERQLQDSRRVQSDS